MSSLTFRTCVAYKFKAPTISDFSVSGTESELTTPASAAAAANFGQRSAASATCSSETVLAGAERVQARTVAGFVLSVVERQRRVAVVGRGRGPAAALQLVTPALSAPIGLWHTMKATRPSVSSRLSSSTIDVLSATTSDREAVGKLVHELPLGGGSRVPGVLKVGRLRNSRTVPAPGSVPGLGFRTTTLVAPPPESLAWARQPGRDSSRFGDSRRFNRQPSPVPIRHGR